MRRLLLLSTLIACDAPDDEVLQVGYRSPLDDGGDNGERGTVQINEILWSGTVRETEEGETIWDPTDIFIELRNEGARPLNLSGWRLHIDGTQPEGFRIPETDFVLGVAREVLIVAKTSGCFPEPDIVIPGLRLPLDDPFRVVLVDIDERLIEVAGDPQMPPFAGGYDLVVSRSMEQAGQIFGPRGSEPHAWHHYTNAPVQVPNNTRMKPECRRFTGASPGMPNSPDYSGAFAAGAFD
ncbi:MAG: hypothetical protein EA397_09740 [Deltaproteobacteria bacterium]|nr:MAG: hypothetical protein EA397_09740 [Deltaproteobacteria bacterium]